jgi:hypothetical protein
MLCKKCRVYRFGKFGAQDLGPTLTDVLYDQSATRRYVRSSTQVLEHTVAQIVNCTARRVTLVDEQSMWAPIADGPHQSRTFRYVCVKADRERVSHIILLSLAILNAGTCSDRVIGIDVVILLVFSLSLVARLFCIGLLAWKSGGRRVELASEPVSIVAL